MLSDLQSFWWYAKTSEQSQISVLLQNSHCAINMMFIYKNNNKKFVCRYVNIMKSYFAENDAAAYTPCLGPHNSLF